MGIISSPEKVPVQVPNVVTHGNQALRQGSERRAGPRLREQRQLDSALSICSYQKSKDRCLQAWDRSTKGQIS